MFAPTTLALKYAIFALISIAANIGMQDMVARSFAGSWAVGASIVVGTAVGLIVKYVLDKHYIFGFRARSLAHDGQTFIIYASMGLATTVVFLGFELGFQWLFATDRMRYVGGVIGLVIGYFTKYQLDKRYVFGGTSA